MQVSRLLFLSALALAFGLISSISASSSSISTSAHARRRLAGGNAACATSATRVRKPWGSLSTQEQSLYVEALGRAVKSGVVKAFAEMHLESMGETQAHRSCAFFAWHRRMLVAFESYLRDQDAKFACLTIPYYDVHTAYVDFANKKCKNMYECSPIFQAIGGAAASTREKTLLFSGESASGLPVKGAPFDVDCDDRNAQCGTMLRNNLQKKGVPSGAGFGTFLDIVTRSTDYASFLEGIQFGIHNEVHNALGGAMATFASPRDVFFYSWHGAIDMYLSVYHQCQIGTVSADNKASLHAFTKATQTCGGVSGVGADTAIVMKLKVNGKLVDASQHPTLGKYFTHVGDSMWSYADTTLLGDYSYTYELPAIIKTQVLSNRDVCKGLDAVLTQGTRAPTPAPTTVAPTPTPTTVAPTPTPTTVAPTPTPTTVAPTPTPTTVAPTPSPTTAAPTPTPTTVAPTPTPTPTTVGPTPTPTTVAPTPTSTTVAPTPTPTPTTVAPTPTTTTVAPTPTSTTVAPTPTPTSTTVAPTPTPTTSAPTPTSTTVAPTTEASTPTPAPTTVAPTSTAVPPTPTPTMMSTSTPSVTPTPIASTPTPTTTTTPTSNKPSDETPTTSLPAYQQTSKPHTGIIVVSPSVMPTATTAYGDASSAASTSGDASDAGSGSSASEGDAEVEFPATSATTGAYWEWVQTTYDGLVTRFDGDMALVAQQMRVMECLAFDNVFGVVEFSADFVANFHLASNKPMCGKQIEAVASGNLTVAVTEPATDFKSEEVKFAAPAVIEVVKEEAAAAAASPNDAMTMPMMDAATVKNAQETITEIKEAAPRPVAETTGAEATPTKASKPRHRLCH